MGRSVTTLCLLLSVATPVAAQSSHPVQSSRPVQPTLVIDGTVLEVETGVPMCGVLATSFWARVHVDAVHTPIGGLLPDELIVQVQCPGTVNVGERHRFELVSPRPTRGSWTMFVRGGTVQRAQYWTLRVTRPPTRPAH